MSEVRPISSLDEVEFDIEGTRKALARFREYLVENVGPPGPGTPGVRTRGLPPGPPLAPGQGGRRLVERCGENVRRRFETLLHFESTFPPELDHAYLIGPACQILESVLERVVLGPTRRLAGPLAEAVRSKKRDRGRAEILEAWGAGRVPSTIGVGTLVLLALRRGRDLRLGPIVEFLQTAFEPDYQALLASKGLDHSLEVIRRRFRNPASHGSATFDAASYLEFTQLVVANDRFVDWDARGPVPSRPDARAGFLHHHLEQARPVRAR